MYPGFFPAVTCEADVPCSVNVGLYPPSSLALFSSARLAPCMYVEMLTELRVLGMAEVNEGREMKKSQVVLRLWNHFRLGFS